MLRKISEVHKTRLLMLGGQEDSVQQADYASACFRVCKGGFACLECQDAGSGTLEH